MQPDGGQSTQGSQNPHGTQSGHDTHLEELLASALAVHDQGGDTALEAFLAARPADRAALERGLRRCREMGLLGATAREFPERLGEFRLLRRLGGGGMGVVYEAEQTSLGRRVALKVIRPELLYFEGARERFRREIEAVARLAHPAIVPVVASGEHDGVPFYAMELVAGRTVQELCASLAGRDPAALTGADLRGALPSVDGDATDPFAGSWWQVSVRTALAVAQGIRHAHLRGIVHRDVKPSNVMLTPHGRTVLLDFGVAMVSGGREFTRSGQTPGSPAFMSPEQLRGDAVDERTDVYSLGATLWQMLTLVPPFGAQPDLARIREGDVPHLRAHNREVPRELDLVVRTAMDRDRERRYPDMEAFAADLQAVLQRRPIAARRLGLGLRLLRWSQRHRVAATALGCLLAGGAALPAVLAWREQRANVALAHANERTEASLATTLDALHAVLTRLGNERLRFVPQAEQFAIESLQDAVALYRKLLPQHPGHERLRQRAAQGLVSLGLALAHVGRSDAAESHLREAIAVLGGDRMDLPPELLDGRAYAEMNLAILFDVLGRGPEMLAAAGAAQRDFLAVGGVPAFRVSALRGRGELCSVRSRALDRGRDAASIEALLRESLQLAREDLALRPGDSEAVSTEIQRLDDLATLLAERRRFDEAEPLLAEALQKARALPDTARIWPLPALRRSDVLETWGNLLLDRKDVRSLAMLRECLELRERVAAEHAAQLDLQAKLGGALHNLGRALWLQARDDEALPLFERAAALQRAVLEQQPSHRSAGEYLRRHLAHAGTCQAMLGRREDLLATAAELAGFADEPGALRTAARLWLRGIELLGRERPPDAGELADRYARSAMDLLLAAEALGWGPGSRLDEELYGPLHRFPEFAALRQRLATRAAQPDAGGSPASTNNASREMPR